MAIFAPTSTALSFVLLLTVACAPLPAQRDHSSEIIMNRDIAAGFPPPGIEQLRGEQLAAAIRGRMIVPRRAPLETPSSEQFYADGTYVRHSDRVQAHGRYEILDDRYCANVGAIRRCFSLHRGRDGQHYVKQVFPVTSGYMPVQLIA